MVITDEKLMAFVDGELSQDILQSMQQTIAQSTELQARVEQLRLTRDLAASAFDSVLQQPVPQRLLDAVYNTPMGDQLASTKASVVSLVPANKVTSQSYLGYALAASITLGIGVIIGMQLQFGDVAKPTVAQADAGLIQASNPLFTALQQTPSLQAYQTEEGGAITPTISFSAQDGRYCREFEVMAGGKVSIGVACREASAWRVEVLLAAEQSTVSQQGYQTASGYSQQALDAVVDRLWSGEAYDAEHEQRLIEQGWLH